MIRPRVAATSLLLSRLQVGFGSEAQAQWPTAWSWEVGCQLPLPSRQSESFEDVAPYASRNARERIAEMIADDPAKVDELFAFMRDATPPVVEVVEQEVRDDTAVLELRGSSWEAEDAATATGSVLLVRENEPFACGAATVAVRTPRSRSGRRYDPLRRCFARIRVGLFHRNPHQASDSTPCDGSATVR